VVTQVVHYVAGGCVDTATSCASWVGAGFCGSYTTYMASACCSSCAGYISAYIKEKENPAHLKWTDEMYVQKMNEELKKRKKK